MEEIEENISNDSIVVPNTTFDRNAKTYTISSLSDADYFCNLFNHNNGYGSLALNNRIQINDGKYNSSWIIVGFDCEHNNLASDGTLYDNGYGIILIADSGIVHGKMCEDPYVDIPYINSLLHTQHFVKLSNSLKAVLGDHLINRRVLLGNIITEYGHSACTWTTSYCTMPSDYQISGGYGLLDSGYDRCDIGESTYMFPWCAFTGYNRVLTTIIANNYSNNFFPYRSFGKSFDDNKYYYWGRYGSSGGLGTMNVDVESYFPPIIYIR